jgi:hypothetical protein
MGSPQNQLHWAGRIFPHHSLPQQIPQARNLHLTSSAKQNQETVEVLSTGCASGDAQRMCQEVSASKDGTAQCFWESELSAARGSKSHSSTGIFETGSPRLQQSSEFWKARKPSSHSSMIFGLCCLGSSSYREFGPLSRRASQFMPLESIIQLLINCLSTIQACPWSLNHFNVQMCL